MASEKNHSEELIAIAAIGKPVGLKGWCRLFPHGETLSSLKLPFKLDAVGDLGSEQVELVSLHKDPKGYRGRFEGYGSRDEVDVLKNLQLKIPRSDLPEKGNDEFYHFELEGMKVFSDKNGEEIGVVIKVHNYPTVDALEVKRDSGYQFVLPMTKEIVKIIDRETGIITADGSAIEELL